MPNLQTPDWSSILEEMRQTGMTQAEIAAAVKLSQASVSDLMSRKVLTTEYTRGLRILAVHKRVMKAQRAKATA